MYLIKAGEEFPRISHESELLLRQPRWNYALSLYNDPSATPDDLREAINTLEEIEPTARRVLGGAHPLVGGIEGSLRHAQFLLRAREAPSTSA